MRVAPVHSVDHEAHLAVQKKTFVIWAGGIHAHLCCILVRVVFALGAALVVVHQHSYGIFRIVL